MGDYVLSIYDAVNKVPSVINGLPVKLMRRTTSPFLAA